MTKTFRGGIHLNEHKNTEKCPIEKLPAPEYVTIPMSQHIGAHCKPLVNVGDTVCKGQLIGAAESGLYCPVHSSISGKVRAIEEKKMTSGVSVLNVVIDNDFENRLDPSVKPFEKKLAETSSEEIIEIVKNAGISGMGGATFPTFAKISSAMGKVDTIIINCAECEPFITANHRLIVENPAAVINGLKILLKAFGLREGIIAVEDNKPDGIARLNALLTNSKMIRVEVLKTKYPQGDERQIIYALTGKELPMGKLPAEVGCVIFNAETCSSIFNAFATGMPLIERIVTVDGDCVNAPKNLLVPIGTPYSVLIDYCGGLKKTPWKIVNGGPMMGAAQWDINAPVTKGTSAILVLSNDFDKKYEMDPCCIRCGRCVRGCPMHLMPNYLGIFAARNNYELAEQFDIMSCVECGSCSYNCPGNVPIVQHIRAAKGEINERKRAKAAQLAASQK
ncbi:MAG: electron transport complex subunit RsxC [Clostridia bacterium]|nr:electron transport complex subunit RsxC [Clostridia bacterium]